MMRLLPPGSAPWLLVHEVRIAFRGIGGKGASRSRVIRLLIGLGILAVFAGWGGWMLAGLIARHPIPINPLSCIAAEAIMAFLGTLMLAQALNLATQAFFERNDLDLLLSSPLPPARVLTVRALGIATTSVLLYLLLASALVLPLAFRGAFQWLSIYVVLVDLALFATALGLLLAMAMFRALGARRTRVVSQVLAAMIGASAFLVGQARNLLPKAQYTAIVSNLSHYRGEGYDPHALYAWPGRAVLGDPVPLLALTVLCAGLFWLVTGAVGRRFAADAAAAAGVSATGVAQGRRRAANADRTAFAGGPLRALARKDWRLLIRDPWLLSQMLLQMVYFVPLGFLIVRNVHSNPVLAAAAPVVFLTAQLAGNLTWVVVSAEDAPELIVSAPVGGWSILQAKLLVSLTPVVLISAVPLLFLIGSAPVGGMLVLACCIGAWTTAALMNVWYAKPADRKQMMRRRGNGGIMSVVEMLMIAVWAGIAFLGVYGSPWALAGALAVIGALVVLRRPTVYRPAAA